MTRRASSPTVGNNSPLAVATLGLMTILLGCGGGGGGGGGNGGPGPQPCGSAANSTVPTICGSVRSNDPGLGFPPVPGSTVKLLTFSGAAVLVNGNPVQTTTNNNGAYLFSNVPANAALIEVDPPSGFFTGIASFNGGLYGYSNPDKANDGPCIPAIGAVPNGDKKLADFLMYPDSTPPPPPFGCPR